MRLLSAAGAVSADGLFATSAAFVGATDIAEDFRIDPTVDVVVPPGARFLIVAPLSRDLSWGENANFGSGVDVTVDPAP